MLRTLALSLLLAIGLGGAAAAQSLEELVAALPDGGYDDRAKIVRAIAATGDPRAIGILEALSEGDIQQLKSDNSVVRVQKGGAGYLIFDPVTGESRGDVKRRDADKVKVNNGLRREIAAVLGAMTLMSDDPNKRLEAAVTAFSTADPEQIGALDAAIEAETVDKVKKALRDARAASIMKSGASLEEKQEALDRLVGRGDRDALSIITAATQDKDPAVAKAAAEAQEKVERIRAMWSNAQNVWYGLSLGSVLMLAAIGLAISFGVMGVINMAHGELVMLGAYATYMVQEVIRNSAPHLFDYSLLIALPIAFCLSGGVGVAIERGVCRWLYGRPLETLLATWGVSLILQQTVRSIFGPTNKEVGNPSWMSGAFDIGQLSVTYNRLWIFVFALVVFGLLLLILKKTPIGLQMRAVTQNRRMADAMGVKTGWVDAMTFGLGAGIAGLAGVALSQIDNVSPNLGQGYIVDSFMVVVFGGVGNLWGALAGAFTLGVVNKFLEPYAGAVLAKVLVLVFIILFIQRRPRGLFALRGRAVEN